MQVCLRALKWRSVIVCGNMMQGIALQCFAVLKCITVCMRAWPSVAVCGSVW